MARDCGISHKNRCPHFGARGPVDAAGVSYGTNLSEMFEPADKSWTESSMARIEHAPGRAPIHSSWSSTQNRRMLGLGFEAAVDREALITMTLANDVCHVCYPIRRWPACAAKRSLEINSIGSTGRHCRAQRDKAAAGRPGVALGRRYGRPDRLARCPRRLARTLSREARPFLRCCVCPRLTTCG